MKRTFVLGAIMAVLLGAFALPLAASAQKGNLYDYIMQDDSGCPVLKFNSRTGQYLFYDDDGLVLAGLGTIRGTPSQPRITFKNSGYYGQFACDTKTWVGSGTLTETTPWEVEAVITDSNMTNNSGQCAVE